MNEIVFQNLLSADVNWGLCEESPITRCFYSTLSRLITHTVSKNNRFVLILDFCFYFVFKKLFLIYAGGHTVKRKGLSIQHDLLLVLSLSWCQMPFWIMCRWCWNEIVKKKNRPTICYKTLVVCKGHSIQHDLMLLLSLFWLSM